MSENKRVAVYLRFKEELDDQVVTYTWYYGNYEAVIEEHEGWQLAGFYVDEGSAKNLTEFKRLLDDCKASNIDMIIARSVSQFGRNIIDALQTAQDLSRLEPPIAVLFEQESFCSLSKESPLMLSFMMAIALAERQQRSEAQKHAWQRKLNSLRDAEEGKAGDD